MYEQEALSHSRNYPPIPPGIGWLHHARNVGAAVRGAPSKRIVSTIFGGKFEEIYRRALIEPFTKRTGVDVVLKYGNGSQWLTSAIVNKDNPEIDLLWLAYPDLCIELSSAEMPNLKDVAPVWYDGYFGHGEEAADIMELCSHLADRLRRWDAIHLLLQHAQRSISDELGRAEVSPSAIGKGFAIQRQFSRNIRTPEISAVG